MRRLVAAVLALLFSVPAFAAPPLRVATSPHFRIYAALEEKDLRAFAEELESYDAVLRRLTGSRTDESDIVPVTIFLREDQYALDMGSGVLGYYLPSAAGTFAMAPLKVRWAGVASLPRVVLFHEYAHHFMLQNFPALYSPWFVEGLAEFYSTVEFEGGKALVGKPESLRVRTLMGSMHYSLKRLIMPGDRPLDGAQIDELYARSWLLVHYLTLSPARRGQIDAYLKARDSGLPEDQAFQKAFGTTIPALDAEARAYFKPRMLAYATVDLPPAAGVTVRDATPGEKALQKLIPRLRLYQAYEDDATLPDARRMDRENYAMFAGRLADDFADLARRLPRDGEVQEATAEAMLLAKRYAEARAAADAAVAIDPKAARAQLVRAAVDAAALKPGDAAGFAAARKRIGTANRLAPNDPLPLVAYYRSFVAEGIAPPALAVQGLERANQLAPQDDAVRMLLARAYIAAAKPVQAAFLLRPIAFSPHKSPKREAAQKLLAALPNQHEAAPPVVEAKPAGPAPATPGEGERGADRKLILISDLARNAGR